MPEPTDHRAEAEAWLEEFRSVTMDVRAEPRDMLLLAEIHALLALSEPSQMVTFPAEEVLSKDQAEAIRKILHG